jgi:hypothetical protein
MSAWYEQALRNWHSEPVAQRKLRWKFQYVNNPELELFIDYLPHQSELWREANAEGSRRKTLRKAETIGDTDVQQ